MCKTELHETEISGQDLYLDMEKFESTTNRWQLSFNMYNIHSIITHFKDIV